MRKFYPPPPSVPTCAACGRKLTAADEQNGRCPGCQAPVEPLLDPSGLTCAGCGHDLRLSPDACPRCGLAVTETVRAINRDALRQLAAKRLQRWALVGCGCLAVSYLILRSVVSNLSPAELRDIEEGVYIAPERFAAYRFERLVGWSLLLTGTACLVFYLAGLRRPRL